MTVENVADLQQRLAGIGDLPVVHGDGGRFAFDQPSQITNAKQLQSMRAEIDAVQRRIDEHEEAEQIEATIVDLDRQRVPLDDDMLARYDQARDRFGGRAVGRLNGDQCSACGIQLSYAGVNTLVEGPPLGTCPSCQRLIVVT